ncbi:MAG TPA: hypothetical protein DDZ67_00085 [Xanthomonadaceae bacterium]|nr:hypothetical protein [Xanthomonadaceae bacterium]
MTLFHSQPNAAEPAPAGASDRHPARRVHPFHALERHAHAELKAMSASPAPAGPEHELLAALGWDLGLSGDELP